MVKKLVNFWAIFWPIFGQNLAKFLAIFGQKPFFFLFGKKVGGGDGQKTRFFGVFRGS